MSLFFVAFVLVCVKGVAMPSGCKDKKTMAKIGKGTQFSGEVAAKAQKKSAEKRVSNGRLRRAAEQIVTEEVAAEIMLYIVGENSEHALPLTKQMVVARISQYDASSAVNEFTFLHIGTHQLITPPREEHILGPQVMVVSATEVQILQCEKLLCRHWKCYDC
jgi:hypothetical protein